MGKNLFDLDPPLLYGLSLAPLSLELGAAARRNILKKGEMLR